MIASPRTAARAWGLLACLGILGCATPPKLDYTPVVARFFIEAHEGEAGKMVTLPESGVQVTILPKPVLMEFDVSNVEVVQVALGRCLLFQFTSSAARDFYRLTGASQGRRLVLALNDSAIGVRRIDQAFADGSLMMFVETPDDQLASLAENLKRTSADVQREIARKR